MIRSSVSFALVAAALAAQLISAPQAAAQAAAEPVVAETEATTGDAASMRQLVNEEALHRDRAARLARLRALAQQRGQADRLAELDRLGRLETQRHEAGRLLARSRMSERALAQTDDFIRRGGVMKVRRANQAAGQDGQRATRAGSGGAAAERGQVQRKAQAPTRQASRPKSAGSLGGSSRGGRSGSGGRSPR